MPVNLPWLTAGAVFAFVAALGVLIEYMLLVNVAKHKGAQRLAFLLLAIVLILATSVARFIFGDYPFRVELLTIFFWTLGATLTWLGWHIAADQIEGARRARRALHKKRTTTPTTKDGPP